MKLNELKNYLLSNQKLDFVLENGQQVPSHFHLTEMGLTTKDFIDCGGKRRQEKVVSFQLWSSVDVQHRLSPKKLLQIVESTEKQLNIPNVPIEVEFQQETIGKFGLEYNGEHFTLTNKATTCLAEDACGIPKPIVNIAKAVDTCCDPASGCC